VPVSVSGSGSPDIVQVLMMRKAMSAEQTKNAQLLKGLETPPAAAPALASAQRTFYL
jgi:hypothetical protein